MDKDTFCYFVQITQTQNLVPPCQLCNFHKDAENAKKVLQSVFCRGTMSVTGETNRKTKRKEVSAMEQTAIAKTLTAIEKFNKELENNPTAKAILLPANIWDLSTSEAVEEFVEAVQYASDIFSKMACLALDIKEAYNAEE